MKITLVTVGKIKEKYLRDAIHEYSKRLSRYCKLEMIEVADEKTPDQASETVEEQIRDKEGERILKYLKDDMYVITLEIAGKMLSSEELADKIEKLGIQGHSSIGIHRTWTGSAEAVRLQLKFFKDDLSPSADAGDPAGAGVPELQDHERGAVSQISAFFSHLGMIWCEVMNHVEYLKGSGHMMFRSLFV